MTVSYFIFSFIASIIIIKAQHLLKKNNKLTNQKIYDFIQYFLCDSIRTILLIFLTSAELAMAQDLKSEQIEIGEDKISIYQFCSKKMADSVDAEYGITQYARLKDNIGNVGPYGITSHVYSIGQGRRGFSSLYISYGHRSGRKCNAMLVVNSEVSNLKVTTAFSHKKGGLKFSSPELQAIEELRIKCNSMGGEASAYLSMGEYWIADGRVVVVPGSFNCDSAVMNNASSVVLSVGRSSVRIAVIFDELFFEELKIEK